MTENDHSDQTTKQDTGRWIAYGAILVGLVCTVIGISILNRASKTSPAVAAEATSIAYAQAAASPLSALVGQSPLPIVTLHPRATAAPTPTRVVAPTRTLPPQVTPDTPTPVQLTSGLFHLVIVHSNDTWGYTLPCG